MKWLFSDKEENPEVFIMKETEDYVLLSVPEIHEYLVANRVTRQVEVRENKLPTTIYQLHSLQDALNKLRKDGLYEEESSTDR